MGFFDFFKVPDINQGFEDYKATPNALLVDVRTPQEYREVPQTLCLWMYAHHRNTGKGMFQIAGIYHCR